MKTEMPNLVVCIPKGSIPKVKDNEQLDAVPRAKPLTSSDFLEKFSKLYQLHIDTPGK